MDVPGRIPKLVRFICDFLEMVKEEVDVTSTTEDCNTCTTTTTTTRRIKPRGIILLLPTLREEGDDDDDADDDDDDDADDDKSIMMGLVCSTNILSLSSVCGRMRNAVYPTKTKP
jgi:hypothetical protein